MTAIIIILPILWSNWLPHIFDISLVGHEAMATNVTNPQTISYIRVATSLIITQIYSLYVLGPGLSFNFWWAKRYTLLIKVWLLVCLREKWSNRSLSFKRKSNLIRPLNYKMILIRHLNSSIWYNLTSKLSNLM